MRNYRNARYPAKQIRVLAELNDCSQQQIRDILERAGAFDPGKIEKSTKYNRRHITPGEDEIIMNMYRNGTKIVDIAEAIGRVPGTVSVRIQRLKKKGIFKDGKQ